MADCITVTLRVPILALKVGGVAGLAAGAAFLIRSRRASGEDATSSGSFIAWGSALLEWIVAYRKKCRELPVISRVLPNYLRDSLPTSAPEDPEQWELIMRDLDSKILPGLTHWEASNRFFAYFKPHSSYPAVLAEMLCAGLNVMGFDWIASPACTELEIVTMDWLAKFLHLPDRFLSSSGGPGGGVIQGSAGESATVVLLAAVVRAQQRAAGRSLPREKMVVYGSDQTHAIVQKATMILGIGHYRPIAAMESDGWALQVLAFSTDSAVDHRSLLRDVMQAPAVAEAIEMDLAAGLVPVGVVGTTGTTSSCAFDDIPAIAAVCKKHGLWLHIDAGTLSVPNTAFSSEPLA
jgi:glutamate/tyrosine decarboxylase-like PLP-dependent enzyme